MSLLPRAAGENDHKWRSSKMAMFIRAGRSEGWKSKIKVSAGLVPCGGSESAPDLSLDIPCHWPSLALPALVDASPQSLPPSHASFSASVSSSV